MVNEMVDVYNMPKTGIMGLDLVIEMVMEEAKVSSLKDFLLQGKIIMMSFKVMVMGKECN